MNPAELVSARLAQLRVAAESCFEQARAQSKGFALRLLGQLSQGDRPTLGEFELEAKGQSVKYEGIPEIAYLGFGIAAQTELNVRAGPVESFLSTLQQLRRSGKRRIETFSEDEVAVLGVADGLARVFAADSHLDRALGDWLVKIAERQLGASASARRMLALAAELVEPTGRLKTQLDASNSELLALDICLRGIWRHAFRDAPHSDSESQQQALKALLIEDIPASGELERAAMRLVALHRLLDGTAIALLPSVAETAKVLQATQSALKRWVWEDAARRAQAPPARWLIDNEYHVQSLLWAVLYPIFREDLVEEEFLQGSVLQQPRTDFGIVSLKLIIEAKILRQAADFKAVEQQIAGDLGLYFKDTARYDRLLVYIYDDCDEHHPELYQTLQHALRSRDPRIDDVVIVRRPNVMPSRKGRRATGGAPR